jgi:hypothetical protein
MWEMFVKDLGKHRMKQHGLGNDKLPQQREVLLLIYLYKNCVSKFPNV